MANAKKFGIQSWCFRSFKDNKEVIKQLKACGVSQIELCGVHADFTNETQFADVIKTYKDAGVAIVSIGVQTFKGDEKAESKFFTFATMAGARYISAHFAIGTTPNSFRVAEKLSAANNVKLAIHNHGGRDWLGSAAMLGNVFANTNDSIGLCLDTAWAMDSGEEPLKMVELFGKRLYGLHVKDFTFDAARRPTDVVVGTGNLKLKELVAKLREVSFAGYTVIEYEGDVDNPAPALTKCVEALAKEM